MYNKFFVVGCTMSGVSSLVNNYRILKNESKARLRDKNSNKLIKLNEIEKGSIFKLPSTMNVDDIKLIINESKKYKSLFVFVYRKNLFEKAIAWYSSHVDNNQLDVSFINNWIDNIRISETEIFKLLVNSKVKLKLLTYEDVYVNDYSIMINELKHLNLHLDLETAELFRYSKVPGNSELPGNSSDYKTLNGNFRFKPEIDIHKSKPGFDTCYDLLCDERIEYIT